MKTIGRILAVILGVMVIISGFYCLFSPNITYLMIGYMVGIAMILDSIGSFATWGQEKKEGTADGWMLACAILSAVLGFFVLNDAILQLSIDAFLAYYIAAWLVLRGIMSIVRAFKIRKLHKNWDTKVLGTHWYLPLCIGILTCAFGILCMFKPLIVTTTVGIFISLGVISAGANLITVATTRA